MAKVTCKTVSSCKNWYANLGRKSYYFFYRI